MLRSVLEIAWPPVCEGCGDAYYSGDTPGLCDSCLEARLFPLTEPYCEVCGQSYRGKMPSHLQCSNCRNRYLEFDFAVGAYDAEGEIMDWIHRFKYAQEIHFARMFGKLMTRVWEDNRMAAQKEWIVVPVPLHRKRLRERGFNQSLEIAREWMRHSPPDQKMRIVNALKRDRYTTRQATLDRRERLTNLHDAFSLSRAGRRCPQDANFIIVDDVLTTGTTASECATVLREAFSPNKITVITVLRG
ncbi:MAG: ComF family protein [Verrucomicrobiales bacterium]|nr:ComF family protein [Verrucomicrobiales bacterium]